MGLLGIFGVRSARRPLAPSGIPRARRQLRVREISGALHSASKQFGRTEEQLAQRFAFSSSIIPVFQRSFFFSISTRFACTFGAWCSQPTRQRGLRVTQPSCCHTRRTVILCSASRTECFSLSTQLCWSAARRWARSVQKSICAHPPFAPALQTSQNSAKRF